MMVIGCLIQNISSVLHKSPFHVTNFQWVIEAMLAKVLGTKASQGRPEEKEWQQRTQSVQRTL